ncbi:MAG: hypothetical protein WC846_00465 [Candidatus Gracilibacteria bacterium]|jgi:hypothetical protein
MTEQSDQLSEITAAIDSAFGGPPCERRPLREKRKPWVAGSHTESVQNPHEIKEGHTFDPSIQAALDGILDDLGQRQSVVLLASDSSEENPESRGANYSSTLMALLSAAVSRGYTVAVAPDAAKFTTHLWEPKEGWRERKMMLTTWASTHRDEGETFTFHPHFHVNPVTAYRQSFEEIRDVTDNPNTNHKKGNMIVISPRDIEEFDKLLPGSSMTSRMRRVATPISFPMVNISARKAALDRIPVRAEWILAGTLLPKQEGFRNSFGQECQRPQIKAIVRHVLNMRHGPITQQPRVIVLRGGTGVGKTETALRARELAVRLGCHPTGMNQSFVPIDWETGTSGRSIHVITDMPFTEAPDLTNLTNRLLVGNTTLAQHPELTVIACTNSPEEAIRAAMTAENSVWRNGDFEIINIPGEDWHK